jgi:hypothetical protein
MVRAMCDLLEKEIGTKSYKYALSKNVTILRTKNIRDTIICYRSSRLHLETYVSIEEPAKGELFNQATFPSLEATMSHLSILKDDTKFLVVLVPLMQHYSNKLFSFFLIRPLTRMKSRRSHLFSSSNAVIVSFFVPRKRQFIWILSYQEN